MPTTTHARGVRIAGTGSALPEKRVTNFDLEKMMDTTDEWIVQRTGVRERRMVDKSKGETALSLSTAALGEALRDAKLKATDLDMIICASVTAEMICPSTACRIGEALGAGRSGAFDICAACSGWVYGMNIAHELIRGGTYNTIGVVGCEVLSSVLRFTTAGRGAAIIFGDGAGAAVIKATDDASKGIIAQEMHADGTGWRDLYIPYAPTDFPPEHADQYDPDKLGIMQMNGKAVFRFAVSTFCDVIQTTLDKAGVKVSDVDQFVCHQSNIRILEAARERFGIPQDKLFVNIHRVGNTSAASVPLCLDELRKAGRVSEGSVVMFVAFGAGLTWASSLWRL